MFKVSKQEVEIDGKKIILETGKIARQADGAIIATCGETVVIATAVGAKRINPDINLTQEVEFGGESTEVDIPMTVEFFWPKAGA